MNKWIVIGRLTKDPIGTESKHGKLIVTVHLAVKRPYKDKETLEYKSDFFLFKAFNKTATFIDTYLKQGDLVLIEATIKHSSWEVDGEKKYRDDYIISEITSLAKKKSGTDV